MLLGLGTAAVSCGNGSGDETSPATTAGADLTEEATDEPEQTAPFEDLSKNGEPRPFRMLVRKNRYSYLFVDEASSDPVEYAVYRRNLQLEDLFGIRFEITEGSGSDSSEQKNFTTFLSGASNDFDLVCYDYWWNLDLQGYFANILEMPEIDPADEWWYQGWNSNVTLNGKMFSIAGDANLEMLENLEVMFFNKTQAVSFGLDLYSEVSSEKWTIDRLMEVIGIVSSGFDDGDSTNDMYGALYDVHSIGSQLYSSGIRMSDFNAERTVSLDVASSSLNIDAADKLAQMMKLPGVNYSSATARARDWTLFRNGKSLIYATALYLGKSLRAANLDFDYGILPMPKYSSEAKYVSSPYGVSVFAIPVNVRSTHESALVLNAMNFYSARRDDSLVTTFYDVVLKYQIADSVDDVRNLDLVRNSVYVDFAFIYDSFLGLHACFKNAVTSGASAATALKGALVVGRKSLDRDILSFYAE